MAFDSLDLTNEMFEAFDRAEALLDDMEREGSAMAAADRDYSIAMRKGTIYEKDRGTPATLIDKLVRGREDIANMRFERDCAEVRYKAAYEAALLSKKKADMCQKMLEREWAQEARR